MDFLILLRQVQQKEINEGIQKVLGQTLLHKLATLM
jgi:hypothetical protein